MLLGYAQTDIVCGSTELGRRHSQSGRATSTSRPPAFLLGRVLVGSFLVTLLGRPPDLWADFEYEAWNE